MAKISRGDVVVARVPERGRFKVRPLVVVQNDRNNARLTNLIVATVTSTTHRVIAEPTQVLVETHTHEGQATGLQHDSAITCENLYTVPTYLCRKIGRLSDLLMDSVDTALKVSLALK
jgi:mRNA interferase MazF